MQRLLNVRRSKIGLIAGLAVLAFAAALTPLSTVHAVERTIYFGGTLSFLHDPMAISPWSVGDGFAGSFSFETTTPATASSASDAQYDYAVTSLTVSIGSFTYLSVPGAYSNIYVSDAPGLDYYGVVTNPLSGPAIGGISPYLWTIAVLDPTGTMFSGVDLPLSPPPLPEAHFTVFQLQFCGCFTGDDALIVNGQLSYLSANAPITTPIPEPETYAMLLAGLGLLGFAARRRKRL